MRFHGFAYFMLGVVATLLAVVVFRGGAMQDARAEGAASDGVIVTAAGENLFVYDVKNQKLAMYNVSKSDGRLRLASARNTQYDMKVRDEIADSKGFTFNDVEKKYKGKE